MKLRWDVFKRFDGYFYFSLMAKINSDDIRLKYIFGNDNFDYSYRKTVQKIQPSNWYDKLDDVKLFKEISKHFH